MASDGRTEVVDGYEEGLNLARRWRTSWVPRRAASASRPPTTDDRSPPQGRRSADRVLPSAPPPRTIGRREVPAETSRQPGASIRGGPASLSPPGRDVPQAPGAHASERAATSRSVPGLSRPPRPPMETPSESESSGRTSWSQISAMGSIDETRTLPPHARPLLTEPPARSTLARRLPDLSDAFPPDARPQPQRGSPSSRLDGPAQPSLPTRGGEPHSSLPPVYEMVAEPTALRSDNPGRPPVRTPSPSSPGGPSTKSGERPSSGSLPPEASRNTSRPLPPLVPERMPSGPYPVLGHGVPADELQPQENSLRRTRRRERLPR